MYSKWKPLHERLNGIVCLHFDLAVIPFLQEQSRTDSGCVRWEGFGCQATASSTPWIWVCHWSLAGLEKATGSLKTDYCALALCWRPCFAAHTVDFVVFGAAEQVQAIELRARSRLGTMELTGF